MTRRMEQHQSSTPVFICQFCRAKLTLTGSYEHDTAADDKPSTSTAFDTVKIDESFIVLDDKRPGGKTGMGMACLQSQCWLGWSPSSLVPLHRISKNWGNNSPPPLINFACRH